MTTDNHPDGLESREIRGAVMDAIRAGTVRMKPKARFVWHGVALVLGILFAVFALLYLVSFITFALRTTGVLYVPFYRMAGVVAVLHAMPWLLVGLALLLVLAVELLVRRYAFSYRRPVMLTVLIIIALALAGGAAAERTHFHEGLFRGAREHRLPFGEGFYREFGERRISDVHRGEVRGPTPTGFLLRSPVEGDLRVELTPLTHAPPDAIREGLFLIVIGPRVDDRVMARDIFPLGPTEAPEWR